MNNSDSTKNRVWIEGLAVPASYNAPTMLPIYIVKSDKSRVGDVFIQYKYLYYFGKSALMYCLHYHSITTF
jgi:hypothetical protein